MTITEANKLIELTEEGIREAKMNQDSDNENLEEEVKQALTRDAYEKLDDSTKSEIKKTILTQIKDFYMSPYEDDKRFAVSYISQVTRENFGEKELVNNIFFYLIFDLIIESNDERIVTKAYDSLGNLTQDNETRAKLANEGYYKKVYESIDVYQGNEKVLDKVSWLTTLIGSYTDMIDKIIELELLDMILELGKTNFESKIRANSVLALSLLIYHEKMFDELISKDVIDLVMELCQDTDLDVKQYATLALVHFALNKRSIDIMVQKGVMDLFNSFATINNEVIQTNVSWIFLALCNNGITGEEMLN